VTPTRGQSPSGSRLGNFLNHVAAIRFGGYCASRIINRASWSAWVDAFATSPAHLDSRAHPTSQVNAIQTGELPVLALGRRILIPRLRLLELLGVDEGRTPDEGTRLSPHDGPRLSGRDSGPANQHVEGTR
jgi:hypothetical protein